MRCPLSQIYDTYGSLSLLCGFGGARDPIETRSNEMYVLFVSNNVLIYHGFNITYATIQSKPLGHYFFIN